MLAYPKLNFVSLLQKDLEAQYEDLGLVWNVAVNDPPLPGNEDMPLQGFKQLKPGRPHGSR